MKILSYLKAIFTQKSPIERELNQAKDIFEIERIQRRFESPWRRSVYY